MNNTLDEILESFGASVSPVATFKGVRNPFVKPENMAVAKQQIQAYYLAEVLDMIGEDKNPDRADHAADKFRIMGINLAKKFIREAAKERFK